MKIARGGGQQPHYKIINTFLSDEIGSYSINLHNGSGRLIAKLESSQEQNQIKNLNTLDNIISSQNFNPNFIKIDTDGFDFKILRSAKHTLKTHHPAIFFEWDKFFLEEQGENPISVFEMLQDLGYEELIIFDNFGNLLCKIHSNDKQNLALLLDYTKQSNKNIYYYDILAFCKHSNISANEYLKESRDLNYT